MEVRYIAFDSFGVKSSCFLVETHDIRVCVDPGVAAEVDSFPLPKSVRSFLRSEYRDRIIEVCMEADVLVITHYHYDHHIPIKDVYERKIVLIKDPYNYINKSQKGRATLLLNQIRNSAKNIEIIDGKRIKIKSVKMEFSRPLWHGVQGSSLGYVIMVGISDRDQKVLYSSDVNGPVEEEYADMIIESSPDVLILDGAPTYLLGYIHSYYNLCRAVLNLVRIIKSMRINKIILDHHLLRDYRYKDLYKLAFTKADEYEIKLHTAAEELSKEPAVIEGYRKYGKTKWKKWKPLEKEDIISIMRRAIKLNLLKDETVKIVERELRTLY